jgi:predicted acyltransferase
MTPPLTMPPPATATPPRSEPPSAGGGASSTERLRSLDVFRGMTVAGMLLVNNPGTWSAIYPPLQHAEWHGWTPTDLIFPFFLIIVGITTELSLRARRARGDDERAIIRQIFRRGSLIFLFGLILSAFPFFTWTPAIAGNPDPSFLDRVVDRVEHLRVLGVLQRIGLAYLFGALLTLRTSWKQQVGIVMVLLFGYWALMTLVPVPDTGVPGRFVLDKPDALLSAWLDRTVLTPDHLWIGSRTWDPEGLLSTLPAIGTMMLGTFAGRWIGQPRPLTDRLAAMFAIGALVMLAGLVWNWVFPINKSIWTSSYVLFTAGTGAVTLATCMWIIDVMGVRKWTFPFVVYGMNPMLAFLGSGLLARLTSSVWTMDAGDGTRISAQGLFYKTVYASWLPPREASFAYALSFVAFWFVILWAAWKRGFVLKV